LKKTFRPGLALAALLVLFAPALPGAARDARIEVYDLRHYTHPNFTRIVVDIGGLREYTYGEAHEPDRIVINIYQAKLNPILQGEIITPRCDYLSQVRIAQSDAITVRVAVDLSFDRIKSYRVYYLPDPFRIVLDIYPKEATDVPPTAIKPGEPDAPRPADPTALGYSMARQLGLGVRTVVIDPGHGGLDPGCLGLAGQKEKDVVLDVALRLRKLLEAAGLNVVMTRESDIFIKLESRCVPANNMKADLFVSIHANASFNRQRAGVETFFLNFSPDQTVNETAARENATTTRRLGEMMDILKKIALNSKIPESRDLAEKIQRNLIQYLSKYYGGIKDLGAKGGPFWVLIGSDMPSVLVEVSHLSNSAEEARLKDETYRQRIAEGIARGILAYRESLGKGKNGR
jgi:N-acetylmuramoyl-L-alanine amidase